MNTISQNAQRWSVPALRFSLGFVLLWIGGLKFVHPEPVVDLLNASFSFLAFPGFVYVLGTVEVVTAALLFAGTFQRWVGLVLMGLFAGTITIFLIAPAVSYGDAGFPNLSLAGEFLVKDVVLFAVSFAIFATAPVRASAPAHMTKPRASVAG
jgi:uncharacterized membrane protein YkgB